MEQVRMPPAQPQVAASKAPAAAGEDQKPEATETASAKEGGFAGLLAALDGTATQALTMPGAAGMPGDALQEGNAPGADTAADDVDLKAGLPHALPLGAEEIGRPGNGAKRPAGLPEKTKPGQAQEDAQPQAALAEHLSMLLNQVRHTLVGQGLNHDSLVQETGRIDAAVQSVAGPVARKGAAVGGAARLIAGAAGTGAGALTAGTSALPAAAANDAAVPGGFGAAATDLSGLGATGVEQLKAALEKALAGDSRVALQGPGAASGAAVSSQAPVPLTSSVVDAASVNHAHVASVGSSQAQGSGAGGGGDAGAMPSSLQQGGASSDVPAGLGQDGALPGNFMEQLGEQVAFWVHQKSQRAEFTLDRDGQPVQVQLALSGDVARVTFLTDHAAARQALDAGVDDLRALLQEQGLALSDVNVGVAGGQGGGANQQGHGDGARRQGGGVARVAVPEAVAATSRRTGGSQALDVFV